MKTIDLNKPILDNKGNEVEGQTLASTLSEIIGTLTEGKTLKLYGWHKTLQRNEPLQLDESDWHDLKELIEQNNNTFIFVKGQLIEAMNS